MKLFKRKEKRAEEKDTTIENETLLRALIGKGTITREQAKQIPSVTASINRIVDVISSLPIKLYKQKIVEGKKETQEIYKDKRLYLLNCDTLDTMTAKQFWKAMLEDYYLGRGAYAYINKDGIEYHSLHYIEEKNIATTEPLDPIYKDYNILVNGHEYEPYHFLKILRNSKDGAKGKSIIEENNDVFSVCYNTVQFENFLVQKGGNKKGFLLSEDKLSQASIDNLKESWRNLYQNNEENVVILNKGMKFQESSNTSVEMQLNENKESNSKDITMLFGIPNAIVKGNASKEDNKNFVKYCIKPLAENIENSLNRDFLTEKEKSEGYYFAFDLKEISRGDLEERYRAYEIGIKSHFLQPDEVRDKEDMKPLGFDWVELGLDSVLYNPKTGEIYTPNTNESAKMQGEGIENTWKGGEKDEDRNKE